MAGPMALSVLTVWGASGILDSQFKAVFLPAVFDWLELILILIRWTGSPIFAWPTACLQRGDVERLP